MKVDILNGKGESVSKLPGDRRRLLVELKVIWHGRILQLPDIFNYFTICRSFPCLSCKFILKVTMVGYGFLIMVKTTEIERARLHGQDGAKFSFVLFFLFACLWTEMELRSHIQPS